MKVLKAVPLGATTSDNNSGMSITDSTSSIVVNTDDNTGKSNVTITTGAKTALAIDDNQNIVMGEVGPTFSSPYRLVVIGRDGKCIELVNDVDDSRATLVVDQQGALQIRPSGSAVRLDAASVYMIAGALRINNSPVLASAGQLNYTITSPGTASCSKALVVDNNRDIANINTIIAQTLQGLIQTPDQPGIRSLTDVDVTGCLSLRSKKLLANAGELNRLHRATPGIALPTRAVILDDNKSLFGVNALEAETIRGSLTTGTQPAICSVGVLDSLSVAGKVGLGTTSPTTTLEIVSNSPFIRLSNNVVVASMGVNVSGNFVLDVDRDIEVSANTNINFVANNSLVGLNTVSANMIAGTLLTNRQPQITSVGVMEKLSVAGDLDIGQAGLPSIVGARLVLSEPDGKLLRLNRTESAKCDIFVSSTGDLELNPTKNVFLRDETGIIMNGGSVTGVAAFEAQTITGIITTSDQSSITRVGVLKSLDVSGAIIAGSVNTERLTGLLETSEQVGITKVGRLSSLDVANGITAWEVVAATMRADSLDGQLLTSSQPNITEVGQLSHLEVQNGITAASVTATTLSGVLTSPEQVAVTKVGRLSSLDVQNSIVATSVTALTLSGTLTSPEQVAVTKVGRLIYLNVENSIVAASVTADTLSGTLTSPEQVAVTKIGTLSRLNTTAPIGIGVTTPTYAIDINTSSLTTPANPSIRLDNGNISASIGLAPDGLTIQTSGKTVSLGVGVGLKFDGGSLTGLNALSVPSIQGTMLTAAQPFITSIGNLSGLTTDFIGIGIPCTASPPYRLDVLSAPTGRLARLSNGVDTLTLRVVDNDFTINVTNSRIALGIGVNLVMNGGAILGLNKLEAASISTPSLTISGIPVTYDLLSSLANATPGTVYAGSFISVDANRDVAGIRNITCSALSGTLLTGIQKNIVQVGVLDCLDVKGRIKSTGLLTAAAGLSVTGSADASAPRLDITVDATTGATTVTPTGGSIAITSPLTLPQIVLGTGATTPALAPLEIGYTTFLMTDPYAYNTNKNAHGLITSNGTLTYNYSIRAQGRVLCSQSVDVMSDRRVKTNIAILPEDYCMAFVENTTPVTFNWLTGDQQRGFGYIAQDLIRAGFADIVNLVNDPTATEVIDDDGFVNPAGARFTVSYQHIIPILARNQRRLMRDNVELMQQLQKVMDEIESLKKIITSSI